jgi:hypothetical protein
MGSALTWFQSSIRTACKRTKLCFARLICLLLGDPRQRPANRARSTLLAGCDAEASRRYLLELGHI